MSTNETSFIIGELSKSEKHLIWLHRTGYLLSDLAKAARVSTSVLSRSLKNKTIPIRIHTRLVNFGVPAELLPEPKYLRKSPSVVAN